MQEWAMLALAMVAVCEVAAERYVFFRDLRAAGDGRRDEGGRRVFGGELAAPEDFPTTCALLDSDGRAVCSCGALSPRWALSAAHCVTPRVQRVQRGPDTVDVHSRYRHPDYRAEEVGSGAARHVARLQHDVGLLRTRRSLLPPAAAAGTALPLTLTRYDLRSLGGEDILVAGWGGSERGAGGRGRLRVARLRVSACRGGAWRECACAESAGRHARAVCAGDSGGPALYRGHQVGVTSMGPVECGEVPGVATTSVLTAVRPYAGIIAATIAAVDGTDGTNGTNGTNGTDGTSGRSSINSLYGECDVRSADGTCGIMMLVDDSTPLRLGALVSTALAVHSIV